TQILQGLAGADLVGFQRETDASKFLRCLRRFTGYSTKGDVATPPADSDMQNLCRANAHPISIDTKTIAKLSRDPQIIARAAQIRHELGNPKTIMLGVDRLDYTKGIRHRLEAYGELLAEGRINPEDTILVQVASPSRERVLSYMQLRDEIELTVGRIHGDYSAIGHQAISYPPHRYPRDEMVALSLAADVVLVTALRDGMNLVAKEYVASRFDNDGVLVLSEFAGASDELTRAVLINPHDIDGLK